MTACKCISIYIPLLATLAVKLTTGNFISLHPEGENVYLGNFAYFHCNTSGGRLEWQINNTTYLYSIFNSRGIELTVLSQIGDRYRSTLRVDATTRNNNTEIRCRVEDIESETVFLRIQGVLEGPPELHARAVNSSTVHITWLASYTLNITSPPSLEPTSYQLLIRQDGDTILSANTTGNEFYYTRENSCQAASYQICVAGRNPVGIGGYSRRNISVSHRSVELSSPSSILLNSWNQFNCTISFDESAVIAWLRNGSYHQTSPIHCSSLDCPHNIIQDDPTGILEVFTDNQESFTLQCAAVYLCNQGDGIAAGCSSLMCFSQEIYIEATDLHEVISSEEQQPTTTETTTTTARITFDPTVVAADEYSLLKFGLSVGTGLLAFVLLLTLLIVTVVVVIAFKKKKYNAAKLNRDVDHVTVNPDDNVIYETCGDPSVNKIDLKDTKNSADNAAAITGIYDVPKTPSPQPDMQYCPAYATR